MTAILTDIRVARLELVTQGANVPFRVHSGRLDQQIVVGLRLAFEARCALAISFETGRRT